MTLKGDEPKIPPTIPPCIFEDVRVLYIMYQLYVYIYIYIYMYVGSYEYTPARTVYIPRLLYAILQ